MTRITGSQRQERFDLKLYSMFDRRRGGLLYVLQAIVLSAQHHLLRFDRSAIYWWWPVFPFTLYLGYMLVRDAVWVNLYRTKGHLADSREKSNSRASLWTALAVSLLVATMQQTQHPIGSVFSIGWVLAIWTALATRGRIPADIPVYIVTWTHLCLTSVLTGDSRTNALLWLTFAGLAAYGLWEHSRFIRFCRNGRVTPE